MESFDVIVVGLGAVGASSAHQLAARGARVLGLDQYDPPHAQGSSHGDTRITRLAVGEGRQYAGFARRSHEIWRELESESGRELLVQCGGLIMGVPHATGQHNVDNFVSTTVAVADAENVTHELLEAEAIRSRYPVFHTTNESGYFEPEAGYLRAEACVGAQLDAARRRGADLRVNERAVAWTSDGTSVRVTTTTGDYRADSLVLAVGPWIGELLVDRSPQFRVHRQVLYWFATTRNYEAFRSLPIFIWMHGTVPGQFVYGFPAIDGPTGGVKLAAEDFSSATTPNEVDRTVSAAETTRMFNENVRAQFPDLGGECVRAEVCLYTVTPDFGFVIDHHREFANVVVASPCSGHGFKHSAAVGEAVAELALGATSTYDLSAFRIDR